MSRLRDILISLTLLLAVGWIFLPICLIMWLTQERVFFLQERTGFREKPFRLIKFSTMRDIREGEREEDNQNARLTPMGKVLRRFSMDEFPQLINVLKGEMSLVGPRPLISEYLPLYTAEERKRFTVLPGITGWAQVNGRNRIPYKERFQLDLWYVGHRSFWLDLRILLKTAGNIFRNRDVYVDESTTSYKFDGTN